MCNKRGLKTISKIFKIDKNQAKQRRIRDHVARYSGDYDTIIYYQYRKHAINTLGGRWNKYHEKIYKYAMRVC